MSFTGKPELTNSPDIVNDGFWPDVSMSLFLDRYRIPSEYAGETIKNGVVLAIMKINAALGPVKTAMQDLGFNSLAAYTAANSDQIDGQEVLLTHYQHAVYSWAKGELLQQFATVNRKAEAENLAKESDETLQYYLDQAQTSIKHFFDVFLPEQTTLSRANAHVVLL